MVNFWGREKTEFVLEPLPQGVLGIRSYWNIPEDAPQPEVKKKVKKKKKKKAAKAKFASRIGQSVLEETSRNDVKRCRGFRRMSFDQQDNLLRRLRLWLAREQKA